jgi:hypothetical protein
MKRRCKGGRFSVFALGSAGLAAAFVACADLQGVQPDRCGNGVVEAGEACDTFAPIPGGACGAPESPGACRPVCTGGAVCPDGARCGADGVCRTAGGCFVAAPGGPESVFGSVEDMEVADVDGDGLSDLVAFTDVGLSVRFQEPAGGFGERFDLPQRRLGPADVADVDGDGRADVVLPVQLDNRGGEGLRGTLILTGQAERRMTPAPFRRIQLTEPDGFRLAAVTAAPTPGVPRTEIAVETRPDDGRMRVAFSEIPRGVGRAQTAVEPSYRGGPLALETAASPSETVVVLAETGSSAFTVLRVTPDDGCRLGCFQGQRIDGVLVETLEPLASRLVDPLDPVSAAPGVFVGDCSDDGFVDVVVTVEGGAPQVFEGPDFRTAERLPAPACLGPRGFGDRARLPLAVGDVDRDGVLDLVVGPGLYPGRGGPFDNDALAAIAPSAGPWTRARLIDLNGDGRLDLAAGSAESEGLDMALNAGGGLVNPARAATRAPVADLIAGDFTGDLAVDLLVATHDPSSNELARSEVLLLAARTAGLPENPTSIGRFPGIRRMAPIRWNLGDGIFDALLEFEPGEARPVQETVLFGSTDGTLFSLIESDGRPIEARAGRFRPRTESDSDDRDIIVLQQLLDLTDEGLETSRFGFFFNDGAGGFAADRSTRVSLSGCPSGRVPTPNEAKVAVTRLREGDDVDVFLVFDSNPGCFAACPTGDCGCTAELFVLEPSTSDSSPRCTWVELPTIGGGVPSDLAVTDAEGNGVADLVVSLEVPDSTDPRALDSPGSGSGLMVFWNLDPDAVGDTDMTRAELFDSEDTFVLPEGSDGGADSPEPVQMRSSVALLQADADPAREAAVAGNEGTFLVQLEPTETARLASAPLDLRGEGTAGVRLAAGDFTRDGVDDLVVARGDRFRLWAGGTVEQCASAPEAAVP